MISLLLQIYILIDISKEDSANVAIDVKLVAVYTIATSTSAPESDA